MKYDFAIGLFLAAVFTVTNPVSAGAAVTTAIESQIEENVITGFSESGPLDIISLSKQKKPELSELLKKMPDKLKVRLADEKYIDVDVTWEAAGDDYETTEYYYLQFSPVLKDSNYSFSDKIDTVLDAPYIAVMFYDEELTGSGELSTMSNSDNVQKIYDFCVNDIGFNSAAACGILANMQAESGFNPKAEGDNGTSYGLCQWHAGRWERLKEYCEDKDYDPSTVTGQMNYLSYELKKYYKTVYDYLKEVSNTSEGAYDAGYYFCEKFEIPANLERQCEVRGNNAKNTFWKQYGNDSDDGGKIKDDEKAPDKMLSQNELAIKNNNEPYNVKKIFAKKIGEKTVWLYAAEEIPYRGFKSKSAADYGVTLSINGVKVEDKNIVLKVKGNTGSKYKMSVSIKSLKGEKYKSLNKKLKKTFNDNSWTVKQYSMAVSGNTIAAKGKAKKTGQIIVQLKKDGKTIKKVLATVFYHNIKGKEQKKTITVKKKDYKYDHDKNCLTFSGNFRGSVNIKK